MTLETIYSLHSGNTKQAVAAREEMPLMFQDQNGNMFRINNFTLNTIGSIVLLGEQI